MNAFPNFTEFYQKPLIPIGKSDFLAVTDNPFATHWLLAMEGTEAVGGNEISFWKVFVFLSNVDGTFDYQNPHFHSAPLPSFHSAFEYIKVLEEKCKCDQFALQTSTENIV